MRDWTLNLLVLGLGALLGALVVRGASAGASPAPGGLPSPPLAPFVEGAVSGGAPSRCPEGSFSGEMGGSGSEELAELRQELEMLQAEGHRVGALPEGGKLPKALERRLEARRNERMNLEVL